ncbi:MAG TPA: DUF1513 domain-containing protein [Burkholderiaceae bacterium]|nr:DUF1513 domain-containing protein [Burkholderiaceae bacterium]
MPSTVIDRRRFLEALAALGIGPLVASPLSAQSQVRLELSDAQGFYLTARKHGGHYEAVVFDEQGRDLYVIDMPARGHSFAIDAERGRAVVFGRQPGFFAIAFDMAGKGGPITIDAAPGRHFFGHGVFTPDGKILLATENDYEAGRGVLGIYDASEGGGFRRLGEYATGGVGPHEVVLLPGGREVCVANGGILTHPDYGKLQLNAETMQSSLSYIDIRTGKLAEQVSLSPALQRLSLRHMVVDRHGAVWVGCQYTGPAADQPPLVGRHKRGGKLEMFAGSAAISRSMKNYVGSVALDSSGTVLATSSPLGGKVVYWDTRDGQCLGASDMSDACGVAPSTGLGFLASNGHGELSRVSHAEAGASRVVLRPETSWDNHIRRIPKQL